MGSWWESVRQTAGNDDAFMGRTHALSAVAVILAVFSFIPSLYMAMSGGDGGYAMLAMFCMVAAGGALLPDLDNTASTAKSSLGVFGTGISAFMRATSPPIQELISSKYDRRSTGHEDAHRGFYHTFLSGIIVGALFAFLCSPIISIKIGSLTVNGRLISLLLLFMSVDLAMSALLGEVWKAKRAMDSLVSIIVAFAISALIWYGMGEHGNYTMIGVGLGIGWIIHILGDMFTVSGAPALFPLKIRGKYWYDIRFLKIKAGGAMENMVFVPLFSLIIIICIVRMILLL